MLAPVVGLIALGLAGLILLGLGVGKVGPLGVAVGAAAALLPVGPVVAVFLWIDRWEPEPAKLLWLAFLWGACGATICALLINSTAEALGDLAFGHGGGNTIAATISAPIAEEAAKGVFLVGLLVWRRQEFDGLVDGIVYAGFVATGFAFTENIEYFGRAFVTYGFGGATGGVIAAFVLRGVLAPFTHPLFTAMTGIGIGIAARTTSSKVRVFAPIAGYVCAVLLHSLWNSSATLGGADTFLVVYFLVILPILGAMAALVVWQRRREQRVVAAQLPGLAAAGWIADSEVSLLSSLAGRRGWRAAVRKRAGSNAARAVHSYQTAATELAFLRDAVEHGTAGPDADVRQRQLLGTMLTARRAAMNAPDALKATRHHLDRRQQ
ncbi:PrsW family intramembrane metalloprotease [Kutzneria buriramensis]|uniref:RsiW-degrading membrane proteinase PrsW (M82 family) n=1 Tax=Kutzneria buriramensis TaxID=1045776 RepID=A0A3E0HV10_9PSEU|nr:PrsW family intramembrane metalloprotease [Kutzneria buriramensis]REH50231.1 RsiW-degrading membrane proteinase PrsW (M82 family) [Kutzneria buriramensis]